MAPCAVTGMAGRPAVGGVGSAF